MIKKCIGCGITLQWEDENELGYIKKDKISILYIETFILNLYL